MPILNQLEAVLIVCAVAVWISRVPYLVGKGRIGRVLLTVPDQTGPQITVPAGILLLAAGLYFISATHSRPSLLPYVGLGIVLLGVALGLNFLFPTQIGTGGILEPYGGLTTWDNIESYSWSEDGKVLELQLHRSIFWRRRSLLISPPFGRDIANYLSHRLWGAEEPRMPLPGPSEG